MGKQQACQANALSGTAWDGTAEHLKSQAVIPICGAGEQLSSGLFRAGDWMKVMRTFSG